MTEHELERWYRILELDFGASSDQVNEQWRTLSRIFHPDNQPAGSKAQSLAEKKMKELNQARDGLRRWFAAHPGQAPRGDAKSRPKPGPEPPPRSEPPPKPPPRPTEDRTPPLRPVFKKTPKHDFYDLLDAHSDGGALVFYFVALLAPMFLIGYIANWLIPQPRTDLVGTVVFLLGLATGIAVLVWLNADHQFYKIQENPFWEYQLSLNNADAIQRVVAALLEYRQKKRTWEVQGPLWDEGGRRAKVVAFMSFKESVLKTKPLERKIRVTVCAYFSIRPCLVTIEYEVDSPWHKLAARRVLETTNAAIKKRLEKAGA